MQEARHLASRLRYLGFQVETAESADREEMFDALGRFERRLEHRGGIALFHYGGHAVQVDGENFLIPVDADLPDQERALFPTI